MSTAPTLKLNKATVHIPIRLDEDMDLTAIRIGKQRIARKRDAKVSEIKQAILHTREHTQEQVSKAHVDAQENICQSNRPVYMDYSISVELDDLAFGVLKELHRLQARGIDQPVEKRYKYKKYIVGFREVERALRRDELKGVIVSTNLESVDELDGMVKSLYENCKSKEVPLIFALNRRRIGKALGKTMKQSLVGIVNLEGVFQEWRKMIALSDSLRAASST